VKVIILSIRQVDLLAVQCLFGFNAGTERRERDLDVQVLQPASCVGRYTTASAMSFASEIVPIGERVCMNSFGVFLLREGVDNARRDCFEPDVFLRVFARETPVTIAVFFSAIPSPLAYPS
jgi:hypothetical protein